MGKLEGGKTEMEGKAMVNINGQWGSICDVTPLKSQWPILLCQYLGYDDIKVKIIFSLQNLNICNEREGEDFRVHDFLKQATRQQASHNPYSQVLPE